MLIQLKQQNCYKAVAQRDQRTKHPNVQNEPEFTDRMNRCIFIPHRFVFDVQEKKTLVHSVVWREIKS